MQRGAYGIGGDDWVNGDFLPIIKNIASALRTAKDDDAFIGAVKRLYLLWEHRASEKEEKLSQRARKKEETLSQIVVQKGEKTNTANSKDAIPEDAIPEKELKKIFFSVHMECLIRQCLSRPLKSDDKKNLVKAIDKQFPHAISLLTEYSDSHRKSKSTFKVSVEEEGTVKKASHTAAYITGEVTSFGVNVAGAWKVIEGTRIVDICRPVSYLLWALIALGNAFAILWQLCTGQWEKKPNDSVGKEVLKMFVSFCTFGFYISAAAVFFGNFFALVIAPASLAWIFGAGGTLMGWFGNEYIKTSRMQEDADDIKDLSEFFPKAKGLLIIKEEINKQLSEARANKYLGFFMVVCMGLVALSCFVTSPVIAIPFLGDLSILSALAIASAAISMTKAIANIVKGVCKGIAWILCCCPTRAEEASEERNRILPSFKKMPASNLERSALYGIYKKRKDMGFPSSLGSNNGLASGSDASDASDSEHSERKDGSGRRRLTDGYSGSFGRTLMPPPSRAQDGGNHDKDVKHQHSRRRVRSGPLE